MTSQLTERMQFYVYRLPINVGETLEGLSLVTDADAPFRLTDVVIWNLAVESALGFDGQIGLRIYRPDGRLIQRAITASNLLFPGSRYNTSGLSPNAAMRVPIRPGVFYQPQSTINFDLLGLPTASGNTGAIAIFCGCKMYGANQVWAPTYPAKWKALPYLDRVQVVGLAVPTGFPSLNNPFTAQADSDFVWQAGVYTDVASKGGAPEVCQLVDLGVIVRDYVQKPYMSDYIPAALLFPFLNAQAPGFLYPEIYIPRNETMLFDFNYLYSGFTPTASPVTITLGLKGMKVYAQ